MTRMSLRRALLLGGTVTSSLASLGAGTCGSPYTGRNCEYYCDYAFQSTLADLRRCGCPEKYVGPRDLSPPPDQGGSQDSRVEDAQSVDGRSDRKD